MHSTPEHHDNLGFLSEKFKNADPKSFRSYPDRKIVAGVTEELLDLLFPEYRFGSVRNSQDLVERITSTAKKVFDALAEQIRIVHELQENGRDPFGPANSHEVLASHLFGMMLEIRQKILEDMRAAHRGDPASKGLDEVIVSYPTYVAVGAYRLAHELHNRKLPLIPRMMTEYAHRVTGIDIHPGADIGRSFFIDHGTGVVIGETAKIGDRVTLYQGVTLGAFNFPKDDRGELIRGQKRHPTIEDDVKIYANSTILGGDTVVGKRSIIGSNVWLAKSVAPDSIVTLEEPKLKIKPKNWEI